MLEDDLLRLIWIADPRISPNGDRIAFTHVSVDVESDEYRTSVWMCDVPGPGGSPKPPRPLTFGARDSQPRWSPDGRSIAFVRKPDAERPAQIHVLPLDGGESRAITRLEGGASSPAWSPDGTRIAFTSAHNPTLDLPGRKKPKHEPGRVVTQPIFRWNDTGFIDAEHLDHVWVVDVAGGEPRALTCGRRFAEGAVTWSRDGRSVYCVSDRREEPWFGLNEKSVLYAIDPELAAPTDGPQLRPVVDYDGAVHAFAEDASGRLLVTGSILAGPARTYDQDDLLLFEGPAPRTRPRVITSASDYAIGEGLSADQHPPRGGGAMPLAFTPDGRVAIASAAWHGASRVVRVDLADGGVRFLTGEDGDVVAGTVSDDGARVAMTLGGLRSPGDLAVLDVATGAITTLFSPNEALFAQRPLGDVETLWFESFDGRRIQGWIVKPPDFDPTKKYPLVLEIHGGPHAAYGVSFFHEFRVLAAAGYVVLYTNPRGSTSYGSEFATVIQYRYPGDDHHDLMAAVDAVVARGYVDASRMGITGGSGGGLLTNWAITHTDRFRAAITQRCVSDWATMAYSCDFTLFNGSWFRGAPFEAPQEFTERSPAARLAEVNTPLMVIHSEEDWRTPIGQGEVMFRGLKQQRKPTVMIRFPGESHELSRSGAPSRRVQNQQHIRRWFDHWLQGKTAPEYGV